MKPSSAFTGYLVKPLRAASLAARLVAAPEVSAPDLAGGMPAEAEGEADTPANKQFLAKWAKRFGDTKAIHEIAVSQYQGIKLWAEAVKKAGSLDRAKMLAALESGPSIQGPGGTVTLDAKTHHATLDIKVMEVKNQKLTIKQQFKARKPIDTAQSCDLSKNPNDNTQYEVKV